MEVSLLMLITLLSHILRVGLSIWASCSIHLLVVNLPPVLKNEANSRSRIEDFCSFNLFEVGLSISKMLEIIVYMIFGVAIISGRGIVLCIENALAQSGVAREDINYVNAHAASTPAGDLKEFQAIVYCFGQNQKVKCNNEAPNLLFYYLSPITHNLIF